MTETYVYAFADAAEVPRELLGGKGAGLAEMTKLGLPVPDGFTITTAACVHAMHSGGDWPDGLAEQIDRALAALEERCGRLLGDDSAPLLVSVRSGAAVSMPGMMETILNLGLNDVAARALADETGDERFAYDSYRRLLQMFGEVVAGVGAHVFEHALTRRKAEKGVKLDTGLTGEDLRGLCTEFKRLYAEGSGKEFPQDPREQLRLAISAVFRSWGAPRAHVYRRANDISDDLGTAANICQMVFGNRGESSGTGVCFSRDPATGEHVLYGEFLQNAQGEDVVAGIRTPEPIARMQELLPDAYEELVATVERLERHHREVQDIEFTVEQGRLYMLQTRTAKRTAQAALRIVREFVADGVITPDEAVLRIDPSQLDQLLHPRLDTSVEAVPIATGLGASPGAAVGAAVFDADTAAKRGAAGEAVVLVRWETTPDDIHGLIQAQGVLTSHGGMTSHAAVVARGMGKPCVAGVESAKIDEAARTLTIGDVVVREGDIITIDGAAGTLMLGALPLVAAELGDDFAAIAAWADERRRLRVRANADTPEDARRARELGAEGIGLCRTEHMFMSAERLPVVREMILATQDSRREEALARLLPMQQADFEAIFAAMAGLPVTVRLLDPPLHEFLPDRTALAVELAGTAPGAERMRLERLAERVRQLSEQNPMLGTRGCRLALLHPGIYAMQVRAIVRGALAAAGRGEAAQIEIMIPLVAYAEELRRMRELVEEVVAEELESAGSELEVSIGTMIELPRAALRAAEIAEYADFFSFGTNDLTQTTLGFSRDDAESAFLATYLEAGVIERNPFASIDVDGVGELVRIGAERGRAARPGLKLGICGEHGGDPASVAFFHAAGLDYVSCSPFRVPIARLAAARAALGATGERR
ncbi:MAG: pyruvate, orthophosphate dikinase [Gaiellales bacterium]|nr:pyruvate, orthophosphate dikinase [Gaiellales bacterium]